MKRFLLSLTLAALAFGAFSQEEDPGMKAERARIDAERHRAEAVYQAEHKACWGKFAVTDCERAAKAKRRDVLADLRRQETSLNDTVRKRQAAEHLRQLDERNSAENQAERKEKEARALEDSRSRQARAAEKAADRTSASVTAPAQAAVREARVRSRQQEAEEAQARRDLEAAEKVKSRQQKQAELDERKAELARRAAERKKQPASSLAVPQ